MCMSNRSTSTSVSIGPQRFGVKGLPINVSSRVVDTRMDAFWSFGSL